MRRLQDSRVPAREASRASAGDRLASFLAFSAPLSTYLATAARGLQWGDGIELAAVCATLGVAHPTGYPTFTLLGHAFTRLPFGTVAFRVTLFCALSMAAAAWLLYRLSALWIRRWKEDRMPDLGIPTPALALACAWTFAWSRGPWTHATVTEVYAFELLLQLAVLALAFRSLDGPPSGGRPALLALIFGLGMTHHLLTLTVLPFLLATILHTLKAPGYRSFGARCRLAASLGAAFLCGLLPILYLPARAAAAPALNWGDPSSPGRLLWTLTGGDYLGERLLSDRPGVSFTVETLGSHLVERCRDLGLYLVHQVFPTAALPSFVPWTLLAPGAVLAGLGAAWLFRRRRAFALAGAASAGLYLAALLSYNIADIRDYQLGFFGLLWPVLWLGLLETARVVPAGRRTPVPAAAGLALALPLALLAANAGASDRSGASLADVYAGRLLAHLPPRAILLTDGDHATFTAWYLQEVEGRRRDVLVFAINFLGEPWYHERFRESDLWGRRIAPARRRTDDAREFLDELARRVIDPHLDRFPVFLTASPHQVRMLEGTYRLEPALRLLSEDSYREALRDGLAPPQPVLFRILPKKRPGGPPGRIRL